MSKKYINALVTDKGNIGIDPVVRESLLTFYRRNLWIDSVKDNPIRSVTMPTEDECISVAADGMDIEFDYLILTWEGNLFDIYRYHHECIASIDSIDSKTNGNWLVAGHIMDQEQNRVFHNQYDNSSAEWKNSFWLFPITALINLKKWKELGRPAWGSEMGKELIELTTAIPSQECVHDNYTPLSLTTGEGKLPTRVKKGWNFINESLKANMPVLNLPNNIREYQNYLYPENNIKLFNDFWHALYVMPKLPGQYKKILDTAITSKYERRIKNSTWQCFIRNTEDYYPIANKHNISSINWSNIGTVMLPCSGFKDFILTMGTKGPRQKVDVIHFDILRECVAIRKMLIENWDGKRHSFTSTLLGIGKYFTDGPPEHVYHMNSMKTLVEAYDHILEFFADEADLEKCWLEFKMFNHKYITADMLTEPWQVLKLIESDKDIYVCLSDIAGWRNNLLSYGYRALRNDIINCVKTLKVKGYNGLVDYKDPATDLQHWHTFDDAIGYLETDV
jgi:hypothetical protein